MAVVAALRLQYLLCLVKAFWVVAVAAVAHILLLPESSHALQCKSRWVSIEDSAQIIAFPSTQRNHQTTSSRDKRNRWRIEISGSMSGLAWTFMALSLSGRRITYGAASDKVVLDAVRWIEYRLLQF